MKTICHIIALLFCFNGLSFSFAAENPFPAGKVLVLCYHDVPKEVNLDKFGVDQEAFVQAIEYFRTHGYHFVGVDDLIAARDGIKPLPEKSILLTFDDAYRTYYDFIYPLLTQYQYPSVLGVVSSWIDKRPEYVKNDLMTWEQLSEVSRSPLVEIASHSHDLHQGLVYNPQTNEGAAAANRFYNEETQIYEDEATYRVRISSDFQTARSSLEQHLGKKPRIMVWPYGKYNSVSIDEAKKAGFEITFVLNDLYATAENLGVVSRFIIYKNPDLLTLLKDLKIKKIEPEQQRIMQVDLDLIYDPDPDQTEKNLGRLLDRLAELKIGTVYLQAFVDPKGTGDIESVYFPNRVLPMRADLFNRVAHQLKTRTEVFVYAWMPMMSIVLPDTKETESLRVQEYKDGKIHPSSSWYKRLSPFSPRAWELLSQLYEDLSIHTWLDGLVFQDDGYFNDFEDFHPDALDDYKEIINGEVLSPNSLTDEQKKKWTAVKTKKLIELTDHLKEVVLYHDPECRFARTLYAPVLTEPESEEWFAQNYAASLEAYDYVVILAYPKMEEISRSTAWFRRMVEKVKNYPQGIEKTVFKVQTYDWERHSWIKTKTVNEWLRALVAAGARHLAYYPDDFTIDQPRADEIRLMMSTEDFPYKRDFQ